MKRAFVLLIGMFASIGFADTNLYKKAIQIAVNELNYQIEPPVEIDHMTTLRAIESDNSSAIVFKYYLAINDSEKKDMKQLIMNGREGIRKGFCQSMMREFIDADVKFRLYYYAEDGDYLWSILTKSSDCKRLGA